MSRIDWKEDFSVNDEEMDNQHKNWIAIYNELHETLLGEDIKKILSIGAAALHKMLDYAEYHFSSEEAYMQRIHYPDLVNHRRIHKDFDAEIYGYHRAMLDGKLVLNTQIIKLVRGWLINHILHEDQKYRIFLEESSKKA